MKKGINALIVFAILVIAVVGVYMGFSSFSVIDEPISQVDYSNQVAMFDGKCNVASDCEDYFRGIGATDDMLSEMNIVCIDNLCGVRG